MWGDVGRDGEITASSTRCMVRCGEMCGDRRGAWRDEERRAGGDGLLGLLYREDRACPHRHLGHLRCDQPEGLHRGRRAQDQLHHVDPSPQQRASDRLRGFRRSERDDRNQPRATKPLENRRRRRVEGREPLRRRRARRPLPAPTGHHAAAAGPARVQLRRHARPPRLRRPQRPAAHVGQVAESSHRQRREQVASAAGAGDRRPRAGRLAPPALPRLEEAVEEASHPRVPPSQRLARPVDLRGASQPGVRGYREYAASCPFSTVRLRRQHRRLRRQRGVFSSAGSICVPQTTGVSPVDTSPAAVATTDQRTTPPPPKSVFLCS